MDESVSGGQHPHSARPAVITARSMIVVVVVAGSAAVTWWLLDYIPKHVQPEAVHWISVTVAGIAGASLLLFAQSFTSLPGQVLDLYQSLSRPPWGPFARHLLDIARSILLPGVSLAFAFTIAATPTTTAGVDIASVDGVPTDTVATQLRQDARALIVEQAQAALEAQGYTASRAERLDWIGVATERADYYVARYPIGFEPGRLPQGVASGTISPSDAEFTGGLATVEFPGGPIPGLVRALAPCGTPDRRVRLRVEGYASSQLFPGVAREVSDELNVRLANLRGERIAEDLESAIQEQEAADSFEPIDVVDYRYLWQMTKALEINDRPGGVAGDDPFPQDFLTRAAHIKVMHPGNCMVNSRLLQR